MVFLAKLIVTVNLIHTKRMLCLIALMFMLQSQVFAEDPFLNNSPEATPTSKPEPTPKFPGYAVYRDKFQRLCVNLGLDGHQDRWNEAIEKIQVKYDSCRNCRQFYKALYCKKTKSSQKTGKASMPSTELLSSVGDLFREIAEDKQVAIQTVQSLNPVWDELSAKQDALSDEYFSILITYIKAPLSDYMEEGTAAHNSQKKEAKKKILENLF